MAEEAYEVTARIRFRAEYVGKLSMLDLPLPVTLGGDSPQKEGIREVEITGWVDGSLHPLR